MSAPPARRDPERIVTVFLGHLCGRQYYDIFYIFGTSLTTREDTMQTLTYVNLSTIIDSLGLTEEQIADMMEEAFHHISYGDASFTLIAANDALGMILWGLGYAEAVKLTNEQVSDIFYLVVGQAEYVNLEG